MIRTAIVAHHSRLDYLPALQKAVESNFLSVDDGTLGCRDNHLLAWKSHAEDPADWNVVIEDDAMPVDGFRDQLEAALDVAPAPIVSLYLGTGYIYDFQVQQIVKQALTIDANWIVTDRLLHAVGVAVRGDLVSRLITGVRGRPQQAIDRAISMWARAAGHKVSYTMPSLLDHRDEASVVKPERRRSPRTGWKVGTRNRWNPTSIVMV